MTNICIIQARRNSNRLPDKVMQPIGHRRLIEHVIARALKIDNIDHVVLATVSDPLHDALEAVALRAGAKVYRGDLDNVLSRFQGAAKLYNADYIMRITGDCPLIDPSVCSNLLAYALASKADYSAAQGFPHGLDCEVFSRSALDQAYQIATTQQEFEHVTWWMKFTDKIKTAHYKNTGKGLYFDYRLVVDYPEDLQFMEVLLSACHGHFPMDYREIVNVLQQNPDLTKINSAQALAWHEAQQEMLSTWEK